MWEGLQPRRFSFRSQRSIGLSRKDAALRAKSVGAEAPPTKAAPTSAGRLLEGSDLDKPRSTSPLSTAPLSMTPLSSSRSRSAAPLPPMPPNRPVIRMRARALA
ncbi:DUF6053 domain-containing protein [Lysobacter capsici]|uniref:DUF6053 domain-containing protein n=1 Tax=Lysobacter capsici TaxID=435897 RepID=UPI003D2F6999